MNIEQFTSLIRTFLKFLAGALVMHGMTTAASWLNAEDTVGLVLGVVSWYASHIAHSDPPATPPGASTSVPIRILIFVFLIAIGVAGCAHLQPGADPIVVRVEQTETTAKAGFDLVLSIDDQNRSFWKTNMPAFHEFCESLRAPVILDDGRAFPRDLALIHSLDQVKLGYKAGRSTSNDLYTTLITFQVTVNEANSWMRNIPTNTIPINLNPITP